MLMKKLRTFLLGFIALILSYLYFSSFQTMERETSPQKLSIINSQKEATDALNYINQLRQGAGLIPFHSNAILNRAAQNHASYLIDNNTYGHNEKPKRKGFTGAFASQRVKHAGYNTHLIIENVSSNNRNYKESVDGLFAAIYHRLAFLDFQGDEIGIAIKQHPYHKVKTAFVYNIGSSALNQLYKESTKISKEKLHLALNRHKFNNHAIITYPFNQQKDVPPVFYNELPDPLPQYDVSGFPISISFNQARFKEIKLLDFKLFNPKGEAQKSLTLTSKNDPNRRLDRFSFVLFPLKRLEWNSLYKVIFSAIVDNKPVEKEWFFKTRNYSMPLHKVEDETKTITVKVNQPNIFYFPPKTATDLLHNVRYNANFRMEFIDNNTLKLTALKKSALTKYLNIGKHQLKLNIQE